MRGSGDIFAGSCGGILRSGDKGANWVTAYSGWLGKINTCILSFAESNTGDLFAGGGGGVFRSTNNGTTWSAVNIGLTDTIVWSLAVSNNTIFAGTNASGVFRSNNNGTSWSAVGSGLPAKACVNCLAVTGNGDLLAGVTAGIFLSSDNGAQWTAVGSNLPSMILITSFALSGATVFAGSRYGVFMSKDNGKSWTAAATGLPAIPFVSSLAISGNDIFAGTYYRSVWRRPLSEMVGANNDNFVPGLSHRESFKIVLQSIANAQATIEFYLPHSEIVNLTVYAISGHGMTSLVNNKFTSGFHRVTWDTRNVAGGFYFVKMQTGTLSYVKSFPILR